MIDLYIIYKTVKIIFKRESYGGIKYKNRIGKLQNTVGGKQVE